MKGRRMLATMATLLTLALVGAACGGDGDDGGPSTANRGGILRIQTDDFIWDADLDPTGEYLGYAHEWFTALHRTLVSVNHKKGGNDVKPDIASAMPTVSADGLTYTFKLKSGIKFAPPVNRAMTSKDIANAMLRLANPVPAATSYPSYYRIIEGFEAAEAQNGKATSISGVTTPDDSTIVFKLTEPTGDFLFRMSMPATSPMPNEITKCWTKAKEYGRYQIGVGPYMIDGAPQLDITSCATMKPISGFDPVNFLRMRRNPNYDAASDSKELRENFIDGADITLNTNTDDIFKRIEAGTTDASEAQPPATVLQKAQTDATFRDNVKVDAGDRTWYIFLNLVQPPFDDLHVRKAVSLIVDKDALVRARGGSFSGVVAEHVVPPDVLGGKLPAGEFDPYATDGHKGDFTKAAAEMKQSKYDTNGDGKCDAAVCRKVLHITRNTPPYTDMAPILETSLAKIGIVLDTKEVPDFYDVVQVPSQTPAIGSGAGWGKDYADASTFFIPLLTSGAINAPTATQNFAYLGVTAAQAASMKFKLPAGGVPSIDADVDKCQQEPNGDSRVQCWADLDKKVMNDFVPWVPYLWANNIVVVSDAVTKYEYDQFTGELSLVHTAVDASKQKQG
ncbi:MAG: ABC transporter substrate-binding protein [Actinomycetota bacterium]